MRKLIKFVYSFFVYFVAYVALLFVKKKIPRNIWLIGELPNSARDNGLCLYEYCASLHYDNVYYVINKKSAEYNNISYKTNVIQYGSFRHILYYLSATCIATCFEGSLCLSYKFEKILRRIGVVHFKEVFLQHGITKDYIHTMSREEYQPDIFITSTIRETDYIIKKYKQPKNEVKLTGMARFDKLVAKKHKGKRIILIAPTWRRYVGSTAFEETEFYKRYHSLLEKIAHIGGEKNSIILYLHNNFQQYSNHFEDIRGLKVLQSKDAEIGALLREADLLVTDYSSIAFDFAYMKKPLVYYQFDHDVFFGSHYEEGYFNYENDGFGVVAFDEQGVLRTLDSIIESGYRNPVKYNERIENTFAFTDHSCCERIVKEIKKILESEKVDRC